MVFYSLFSCPFFWKYLWHKLILHIHYMDKSTEPCSHYTYRSCSAMKTHVMKLLACGLELCSHWVSREMPSFTQYAPLHLVTLLSNFMWSAISCWLAVLPKYSHFAIIPHTPNHRIFRREEISRTFLLQWWNPITAPHSNSVSSLELPILQSYKGSGPA